MSDTPVQAATTGRSTGNCFACGTPHDAAKQSVLKVQNHAEMSAFCVANLFTRPRYGKDTIQQMDDIGVGSLPIVLLSGFFIGAVLVMETGSPFARFGEASMTGDVV